MYMAQADWPVQRFRELLDRIVDRTGRSQSALAALVPMTQGQLSRWRSGVSRPKYDTLGLFADAIEENFPSIGISRQEILAAGGYGDTLPVQSGPIRVSPNAPTPPTDPYRDPGDLPDYVDLTSLSPEEAQVLSSLTLLTPDERLHLLTPLRSLLKRTRGTEALTSESGDPRRRTG